MPPHEKKANKRMPTPKEKLIHNPIPTSLFLSAMCLLLDKDTSGTIDSFLTKSMFTQTSKEVGMGSSFQRNDFSTCTRVKHGLSTARYVRTQ